MKLRHSARVAGFFSQGGASINLLTRLGLLDKASDTLSAEVLAVSASEASMVMISSFGRAKFLRKRESPST